jgi:uncharacterized membrane protein
METDNARRADATADAKDADQSDTARLESFSDGVFAVAITLLVLNIPVPTPKSGVDGQLLATLAGHWPDYLAYTISFVFILIMWINHHRMFRLIHRSDHTLLLLNGLLLLLIALVPFATALLAEYFTSSLPEDARVAAVVFNGLYLAIAVVFNLVWLHAARGMRLLAPEAHQAQTDAITRSYVWGPALYALAVALAFVNAAAGVLLNVALAVYWALPPLRRVRTQPR